MDLAYINWNSWIVRQFSDLIKEFLVICIKQATTIINQVHDILIKYIEKQGARMEPCGTPDIAI